MHKNAHPQVYSLKFNYPSHTLTKTPRTKANVNRQSTVHGKMNGNTI